MRKVMYIPQGVLLYSKVTPYKTYDIVSIIKGSPLGNKMMIINDDGVLDYFFIGNPDTEFLDVTMEIRNEVIDDILS